MNRNGLVLLGIIGVLVTLVFISEQDLEKKRDSLKESIDRAKSAQTNSDDYETKILTTFQEMANAYEEITHVTLDGSILDVHYSQRVSTSQFRQDAAGIATSFSKKKLELTGTSHVTVRCVFRGRIYAQADAARGKVTNVES